MIYFSINQDGKFNAFGSIAALADHYGMSPDTLYSVFSRTEAEKHTFQNGLTVYKARIQRKIQK